MSLGSNLIRGSVLLVLCGVVGVEASYSHRMQNNYQSDHEMTLQLQKQYQKEKHKQPTVKRVTSVYQQAMTTSKRYLALQNKLHDLGDVPYQKQKPIIVKMNKYVSGNLVPHGNLIQPQIKDWHAVVDYGGQTGSDRVVMAYRWFDKSNQLMRIDTFYYQPSTKKLSGFSYYITNNGAKSSRDQVRGWKD